MSINNKVDFNKKYIYMNFFKNPKYKLIRVILLLIIIFVAGWFTVSNMQIINSNKGQVVMPNCTLPYQLCSATGTCVLCPERSYWSPSAPGCCVFKDWFVNNNNTK